MILTISGESSAERKYGETNSICTSNNMRYYPMIEIKEVACYLSLLEGGDVQDKLECEYLSVESEQWFLVINVSHSHFDPISKG